MIRIDRCLCWITIGLGFTINVTAQAKLRDDILPHSPEAAAFEKFVEAPVTLYTGLPSISIPIYDIKCGSISLPVQLSYNYSGYRPTEEATWVGLGWSLNAGGCITRTVKGSVDASPYLEMNYDDFVDITPLGNKQKFLAASAEGHFDTEPDLYTFNFSGYSGKFLWVRGEAVMVPLQDLLIKKWGAFGQEFFTITTPDGTTFTFEVRENTEQRQQAAGVPATPTHTSAWFLSKVQSADKLAEVNFFYTDYEYQPRPQFSCQFTRTRDTDAFGQTGGNETTSYSETGTSFPEIHSKQLSTIQWDDYLIVFEGQQEARRDLINNSSHALKAIHISNNLSVVKNISLEQIYVGGNTNPTKMLLKNLRITTLQTDANGNFIEGETNAGEYSFQYEQENGNFPIQTKAIDYGNYYNGVDFNTSLFPCGFIASSAMPPCGIREPNFHTTSMGAINKITYPTGGYTTFKYEQNTLPGGVPQPQASGKELLVSNLNGTKLSREVPFSIAYDQTVTLDYQRTLPGPYSVAINNDPIVKIYNQNNLQTPVYVSTLLANNQPSNPLYPGDPRITLSLTAGHYILKVTCQANFASTVAHLYFTEPGIYHDISAPGLRIQTIKSYDNLNQDKPAIIKNYRYVSQDDSRSSGILLTGPTISEQVVINKPMVQLGVFSSSSETHTFSADASSSISSTIDVPFYYSRVVEINGNEVITGRTVYEFKNGGTDATGVDLVKKTYLKYTDGTFKPLKEQGYEYTIFNNRTCSYWRAQLMGTGLGFENPDIADPYERTKFFRAVDNGVIRSSYKVLTKTQEIDFDENCQNAYMKEVSYEYSNHLHHFPTATTEYNTRGEMIRTQIKYPLDFVYNGCTEPALVQEQFKNEVDDAVSAYYTCASERNGELTSLQPFYPNSQLNKTQFMNIVNSYPCEDTYKGISNSIWVARSNRMDNYTNCLENSYNSPNPTGKKAILLMQKSHIISPIIEKIVSIQKNGVEYLLSAYRQNYVVLKTYKTTYVPVPSIIDQVNAGNYSVHYGEFASNPSAYYKPEVYFKYDENNKLLEQGKINNIGTVFMWDHFNQYPIAEITPASSQDDSYAYTSFETESKGGFIFNGVILTDAPVENPTSAASISSITGRKRYLLAPQSDIEKNVNESASYTVSLWRNGLLNVKLNGNPPSILGRKVGQWQYCEWVISGKPTITISSDGPVEIDELRLYPFGSHMNTYTYAPGKGITSKCDVNNRIAYYYYDGIGRLQLIRDQDKNVLKQFCYTFAGLPSECGPGVPLTFESNKLVKVYRRNNCGTGRFKTCSSEVTVPAGMFTSTVSQYDADGQALSYANTIGQNQANDPAVCSCVPITNVPIKCLNKNGETNFRVVLTNVETGHSTYFNVSESTALQTLGSIDNGVYHIKVERPGYHYMQFTFSINCNGLTYGGEEALFSNVSVEPGLCNVITIDGVN